jgi:glycolate oxidase FAD binding subunit
MADPAILRPRDVADVVELVESHARPLEPVGGGSKRSVGRPVHGDTLDLTALAGITDYSPGELVLTTRAATPVAEIEAALQAHGQRLAFEPPDFGVLLGSRARPTLGGALAANVAGSRRVFAGAARDHFLGCTAVDGRGARFAAGGKVVKNVTGYDLPKVLAGSWGTLAVLTEATVRVVPAPEVERTLVVPGLAAAQAVDLMTRALGAPLEVSSAAFDTEHGCMLRLEGFAVSVTARAAALRELAGGVAHDELLDTERSRALWRGIGNAAALAAWPIVWRICVPPADGARVLEAIAPDGFLLDWGGGLIWAAYRTLDAARVRGALGAGHATLFKASRAERGATPVFHPQHSAVAALGARLKAAFDPNGKLNPGRMG